MRERFANKESCATARGKDLVGAITGSAPCLTLYLIFVDLHTPEMKLNKCCRNRLFYFTFILFCVGCVDCFCCNRSRFVLCWSATKAIPTVFWLISLLCVSSITVVSGMTCFSGTSNLNSKLKKLLVYAYACVFDRQRRTSC